MDKILHHQGWYGYPIIDRVLTIPGGTGFSSINSIYHLKLGTETSLLLNERSKREQMASFPTLNRDSDGAGEATWLPNTTPGEAKKQKNLLKKLALLMIFSEEVAWFIQANNNIHQITVSKL